MSILGILFLGEERTMIHRAAMALWEHEHHPGQNVLQLMLSLLTKIPSGITTSQDTKKT
jgi:hypothetical protein